ncbi:uncharacterized protein LOC116420248 [Sarcophilus harrisii]|uniref:uncharacterized protein LOC116420248 n=1 Tax=Sarcophilus harrisii TaxID=9305 RepID=UPI001301BD62|nr:uncharacterized protein LOC116420248 [Sarcophilus harrisii]
MALSKHQKKSGRDLPELQEEEPVLTFHGPRMRKGQGISMVFEDMQVKYLVRYRSGTGVSPGVVTCLPYSQPQYPALSRAWAQEPETVPSGSKAKASTSRAGPSTSKGGPSTAKGGPSTSKAAPSTSKRGPSTAKGGPSTSKAAPSTSKRGPSTAKGGPSTSKAAPSTSKRGPSTAKGGPSTSKAAPSTSKRGPSTATAAPSTGTAAPSTATAAPRTAVVAPSIAVVAPSTAVVAPSITKVFPRTCRFSTRQSFPRPNSSSTGRGGQRAGGAILPGASGRNSSSSGAVSQGAGGASASGPQSESKVDEEEFSGPAVCGWEYEWLPETRVLRYSTAQLKYDSDTAIHIACRKERRRIHFPGTRFFTHSGSTNFVHGGRRPFSYGGGDVDDFGDPGEGTSCALLQPPPKRSREKDRAQGRAGGSRGDAGDPRQVSSEKSEIRINLPKPLKPLLMQDWEMVTFERKLCNLPAKISVEAILAEYVTFPQNCRTRDKRYAVSGLVSMLKEYFNVLLTTQLLYDFERPQYAELVISYPSSQMCQLYGGVHLLRLFQQLGPMLTCTPLDESSLKVLMSHLQDFLDYLANDPSLLFVQASDYEVASEEYLKAVE